MGYAIASCNCAFCRIGSYGLQPRVLHVVTVISNKMCSILSVLLDITPHRNNIISVLRMLKPDTFAKDISSNFTKARTLRKRDSSRTS